MKLKSWTMNFNTYATWLSRNMAILLLISVGVFFNSCKEEQLVVPMNVATVNFTTQSYTIERNSTDPITINVTLGLPLEEEGTVVISLGENNTALSNQYVTDPASSSGEITLHLPKNATEASFTLASLNNFADNVDVELVMTAASGGVQLAKNQLSTVITMKGNNPTTPELTASVTSLPDFGLVNIGEVSASQSYTVSTRNLTQDVTITAPDNFSISLDNITFTDVLTIPFASTNNSSVEIFVRFEPASGLNKTVEGAIANSCPEYETAYVSLTGQETGNVASTFLLNDDFDYGSAAADIRDVSGWILRNASTTKPVRYVPAGLSLPDLPSAGGAATMSNGSNCNVGLDFSEKQTTGVTYTGIMVNISAAPAGSVFFFSHMQGSTYFNRLYAQDDNGTLKLGIARAGTTVAYTAQSLKYNTTYLAIIKYDFSTQTSSLYVLDGNLPMITEPATADATSQTDAAPSSLESVVIRQSTGVFNATLDAIRVSTSWRGALGF